MNDVIKALGEYGIVPVVVLNDAKDAEPLAKALCEGGLKCAEVTFRTAAAEESIKIMAEKFPDMLVGAGTVLTTEQVDRAVAAGAKFIVSPGLNPKVVKYCVEKGIPVCPGTCTPSEMEQAMKDADSFYQRLSSRMERRYLVDASQTEKERKRLEARNQEIDGMFLSLYTDKAKGILTEQRFMKLTAALEQEQEANQKRLHDLLMMQSRADAQESEVRTFIKEIRRYSAIEELDEAMLNRLISRILIGEVKTVDGQKVQKVKIVYNFVGEIPEIAA